jgi:predicted Zn-ribbon and HTH transcriptional regulator
MRYRHAKYGYHISKSELTIETYCPSCRSESKMTIRFGYFTDELIE